MSELLCFLRIRIIVLLFFHYIPFSTMPPTEKQKDISHRHRSFKGCWTCKKKRIQCDEMRPTCQKCSSRGLTCEGYEIRLRWGAGIASRGKYSGAEKPVKESIPPRSKRRWDMRDKGDRPYSDGEVQPVLIPQSLTKEGIASAWRCLVVVGSHIPLDREPQFIAERATVNILNSPWEPGSPRSSAINKHFEIPTSLAALAATTACGRGPDTSGQYGKSSGRRSILA
jgi:Fungal Zn(2)-Cys(6) binuclear cluster domain.